MDVIKLDHLDTVVFYDERGSIVYMHDFATSNGGVHPSQQQREKLARESAARAFVKLEKLSVLHIDPKILDPRKRYRVEPESKRLLSL